MEKLCISGGKPLTGTVTIGGMKNAALPIIFATILVNDVCILENLPEVSDIYSALEIVRRMGAGVEKIDRFTYRIDTRTVRSNSVPLDLARIMRGSYYVLGAELGRFGRSHTAIPGGCNLGARPIDQHIKGFEALGATVNCTNGISCYTDKPLEGTSIYLDVASVGATCNIMLAAATAKGMTIIENAAREPHIVDLANFLNSCGADITGAGTEDIKIRGVESLHGGTYAIIPDMIEAGTYMIAAAATKGDLTINNVIPRHLEATTRKLLEMGVEVEEGGDYVRVSSDGNLKRARVKTDFYPGFPTDMNPQFCVLLCLAEGESRLTESVMDSRFKYTDELIRMGADITIQGRDAIVQGIDSFRPANVRAVDLRAGAAMVIAALSADGTTVIDDIYHIQRGYEDMVGKLRAVGADIKIINDDIRAN
ncbi:MAG: UDP-N-acetylglucosamine 1-carboxyvinyltransferase [Clostridia bacterium]|nr:UDP-N-acetylglucosamine 1-carboxyvinyltransferase [Clostridia bacterium]MBR5278486.1 UDP-N-acetylglucosamine 1-carboxyvinyltransferase [Clostridia bacterium]